MSEPSQLRLEQMRRAIERLPEPTRTIYRLHLLDGLDYNVIADRATLNVRDVERHIAEAIVLIDRDLRRQERGDPSSATS